MNPIHIIDVIPSSEEIEDGRTADTVVLGQVQVVANAPNYLGFTQHIAVMFVIF